MSNGSSTISAAPAIDALSESERLLIASLRVIAIGLAEATHGMSKRRAEQHVDGALFELVQSLGHVSESFATETSRFLKDAVQQARMN